MEWTRRVLSLSRYVNQLVPCFFSSLGRKSLLRRVVRFFVFFFLITLFLVEKYYMFTVKGTEKESFKNNYS